MSAASPAPTPPRAPRAPRELAIRRRPTQSRSIATFEHVLAVSAELLDEVGWDGFTTNLVAERAGVSVRAVYRYFPNKLAIVSELALRSVEEWDTWFFDLESALVEDGDEWLAAWDEAIDRFVEGVRAMPGGRAIRRAMGACPELRRLDREDNERLAERLAGLLRQRSKTLRPQVSRVRARMLIESAVAVVDLALDETPAVSRALIDELKAMQRAFLRG